MFHGIINIKKEKNMTSHDVVAILRGILKQKKIGHTGTLDPDATGVLPICLGVATKLCELLTDKNKEYETEMLLGKTTDTQDISGKVLKECTVDLQEAKVIDVINSFVGSYNQLPPMYSAIKINGKKLVDLAREGIEIKDRPKRTVNIYSIEILEIDLPRVRMKVFCSKGTYIRTLCNDIGEKLGVGACMSELVRTKVDKFTLDRAITLDEVKQLVSNDNFMPYILKVDEYFMDIKAYRVKDKYNKQAINGNNLTLDKLSEIHIDKRKDSIYFDTNFSVKSIENDKDIYIRIYDCNDNFLGVYKYNETYKTYKPYKMFMVNN